MANDAACSAPWYGPFTGQAAALECNPAQQPGAFRILIDLRARRANFPHRRG